MTKRATLIGVVALLFGALEGMDEAYAAPVFVEAPCDIPIVDDAVRERLRCGTVSAPRDAAQPADGTFELAVVVKRSAAPTPGAAPILFLHGGPGGEQVPYMGLGARDFTPGRDLIAFDMRGGGRTGPALCGGMTAALFESFRMALRGDDPMPTRESALDACMDELAAAGYRPEHFGSVRNVEDAERIRQSLGIERWAVYGTSYGTTVGAEYLSQHPGAIESLVLDSLYPPDAYVHTVREAQGRAIGRLLDECASEAACAARFPGLDRAKADAALASFATDPLPFHLGGERYVADERAVRSALYTLFYREETARSVPWFINAVVRRDGDAVAAALGAPLLLGDVPIGGVAVPGLLGTDCRDRARHHAPHTGPGPNWMDMFLGIPNGACRDLPLGTVPGLPVGTTVPVLVLSAGYDGFQPDGEAVAAAIGQAAIAYLLPRAAHSVRGAGDCPRGIISAFINDPSKTPDTTCIATMTAPSFVLDVRPMPAITNLGAATSGGRPPAGVLVAAAGFALVLLAGIVVPAILWLWRRLRRYPAAPGARGVRALAVGGGLLGVAGAVLPVAGTMQAHPGIAGFGLEPTLALGLWAIPVGGALALLALGLALRKRQWGVALAALGGAVAVVGILVLGLTPWG
jgi:pimeloyl-ACP methyl ester carboxylesterase